MRRSLLGCIEAMAPAWPPRGVRWVGEDGMHLTLRFLGDTARDVVPALSAGLNEVALGAPPMELALAAAGCFPNPRRPRVIWVGVSGAEEELARLQRRLDQVVRQQGWGRQDKPFHPHLTLGRVREGQAAPAAEWLRAPEPLPFRADTVHLVESRLSPAGAHYTSLHAAVLGGA